MMTMNIMIWRSSTGLCFSPYFFVFQIVVGSDSHLLKLLLPFLSCTLVVISVSLSPPFQLIILKYSYKIKITYKSTFGNLEAQMFYPNSLQFIAMLIS